MTAPEELLAGVPTPAEIGTALEDAEAQVADFFGTLPDDVFFAGSDETWSPAHHVSHLTLSNRPLTGALRLPKLALLAVGGKTTRESRSYLDMCDIYRAALKAGGSASGRYLPVLNGQTRAALMSEYRDSAQDLRRALESWKAADLDTYLLPHPLLGKLTVREMLYFSVYHQHHHQSGVQSSISRAESESEQ